MDHHRGREPVTRFVFNPGFEVGFARSVEMREKVLRPAAKRIAEMVEQTAPRQAQLPEGRRKHYVEAVDYDAGLDEQGQPVGRVNAFHFTSLWIEFGSINNPPYAPLRRALDGMRGRAL
jgi:hypothetical protein